MPKMSGPELAARLVATRTDMKVVFMSGYTDKALLHHGALAEGIEFLQKPVALECLARRLREVLDGGARVPQA